MKTNHWIESSQQFYRRLLRLYPQAYRAEYEAEMFNVFTDQCREAYNSQGWRGIVLLWPRILVDTCVTAVREHITDPQAQLGLLEATPDAPLPWKGVLLVLIPGLIFFVSQIAQVTTDKDWFFLAFYRAGYVLILPVLLVWLLTRRFPVWGLIPLGLLYETLWNYAQRVQVGDLFFIANQLEWEDVFYAKYLSIVLACMVLLSALVWHNTRHRLISRAAWKWLGLCGLLIVFRIAGEVYNSVAWQSPYWSPGEMEGFIFQNLLWYLYDSLPFLLLIFIGMFFARKYGGLTFLILLGYLLPTVVFGRYGVWNEVISFYVVSFAVLTYRFVVALVAPIWLARAASISGRQRAVAIPVAVAIVSQIALNVVVYLAWAKYYEFQGSLLNFLLTISNQLIIAAGLGLAVALYLPADRISAPAEVQPPAFSAVED